MAAMILPIILIVVVLLAITTWSVRFTARMLKAEQTGWGRVLGAVVIAAIAGGILEALVQLLGLGSWLSLILQFLVSAGIYAWLLGATPLNGLAIAAVSSVIAIVFLVVVGLILGALGLGGGLMSSMSGGSETEHTISIEEAVELVCDCRNDQQCLQQRYAEVIFMAAMMEDDLRRDATHHLEKARRCVNLGKSGKLGSAHPTPDPIAPGASDTTVDDTSPAPTPSPATTVNADPPATTSMVPDNVYGQQPSRARSSGSRWQYRPITLQQTSGYMHETIRITRKDNGKQVEGVLTPQEGNYRSDALAIARRQYGGTATMQIPLRNIAKIEVRQAANQ